MKIKLRNDEVLKLREVRLEDAQALIEYMKQVTIESDNLLRGIDEFTMTLTQEEDFIKNTLTNENNFMAVGIIDNTIVSTAGFHGSNLKRTKHRVSLGISVLKEYYNLGIGTHMMNYIIDKAKTIGKTKMELDVRIDNNAAIHLYQKLGFQQEGIISKGFHIDQQYIDLLVMGYDLEE